jgi:hypothetical protein
VQHHLVKIEASINAERTAPFSAEPAGEPSFHRHLDCDEFSDQRAQVPVMDEGLGFETADTDVEMQILFARGAGRVVGAADALDGGERFPVLIGSRIRSRTHYLDEQRHDLAARTGDALPATFQTGEIGFR